MSQYVKFLMKPVVKVFILVFFIGLTFVSIYVADNLLQVGYRLDDVLPDESYTRDMNMVQEYVAGETTTWNTEVYYRHNMYHDEKVQEQMRLHTESIRELEYSDQDLNRPRPDWFARMNWTIANGMIDPSVKTM